QSTRRDPEPFPAEQFELLDAGTSADAEFRHDTSTMTRIAFAIPGDIALATGGYGYDRRVMALLPGFGIEVSHVPLPGSFPAPTAADLDETQRKLAAVPADAIILADGLAYGALPDWLVQSLRSPIVALVHHPLCLEAGLKQARRDELYALEKAALAL